MGRPGPLNLSHTPTLHVAAGKPGDAAMAGLVRLWHIWRRERDPPGGEVRMT
jgi:hypothetical protein